MRKSSPMLTRVLRATPLATIVVLALSGCGRSEKPSNTSAVMPGVPLADSGAGSSGYAPRAAPADAPLRLDASPEMAAAAAPPAVVGNFAARDAASRADGASASASASPSVGSADLSRGVPLPAIDPTGAMLVRHGQASIEVVRVKDALPLVRRAAAQYGGFVANTAVRAGKEEQRSATLELRVPSDKFDGLLSALSDLGKVESVTSSAEDVAEEYVDLGARAANARRVEARLVELLATRTGKLSDVLTVEQELARVRMETERYDARLRWLERRASLSSLDITIHEPLPMIETHRGPGPIADAIGEAWSRMLGVVAWCIASLGVILPLGVLIGGGVLVWKRTVNGFR